ncbi:RNA-binding domain-containing protein [Trametes coccinea BRFM310]|uniref:RNA-binding domain-containing protein n=1 Tax=Trametes coccinea (strain BRFM310) TaxID=1353009 RepID=A0A1Y2ILC0_TRAC3|nr:RNA-binding domain-containing protein [Trametes coccinea BRFM310]
MYSKMFIGGLNWDTTDESLRKYFSQFGKVEACTIMRDAAGRSRCFAFLTFEDPASVNAVMVREHFLDGKIIDPKRAIPRQEHQRATKLFIGGLPGSVTSESMREYFSQFGKVVDATVMLDRETGRSKGFGFVSFENVDVTPMLGFGNLQIDGKLIDVKLAQPRSQREGFAEQSGGGGGGGRGNYGTTSAYGTQNFAGASAGAAATGQGGANAPFDPQALAQLYTRMISQIGGMNPMMGAMNPAMMGGQYGAGGMAAGGAAGGMGMRMGGPGGAGMGMQNGPGSLGPNVPRGPRNAAPPTGPSGGVGPQRAGQRGQHSYHPYAR